VSICQRTLFFFLNDLTETATIALPGPCHSRAALLQLPLIALLRCGCKDACDRAARRTRLEVLLHEFPLVDTLRVGDIGHRPGAWIVSLIAAPISKNRSFLIEPSESSVD
jgi:hypothetical protein